MAFSEELAQRIRKILSGRRGVAEKKMMGGLAFMVNGKMCVGVLKDDLMCRIDPEIYEMALKRPGCRPMDFTGRPMRGFVFVDEEGTADSRQLKYWIDLSLEFNPKAKRSKKASP